MKYKNLHKKANFDDLKFLCFPQRILRKKASNLHMAVIQIIIIGLIFALFIFVTIGRIDSKEIKQQVVEKELALLIDSGESGFSFSINKLNRNGEIKKLWIEKGRVFALIDSQQFSKGYPYFSKYSVSVREEDDKFIVGVK